jgi:putative addiction module killer protein
LNDFEKTDEFAAWLKSLDKRVRQAIVKRIDLAEMDRLGKILEGTGGIFEIAMDTGPGYRLYYCREDAKIFWLLIGGIKDRQKRDVAQAQRLRDALKRSGYGKAN